METHIKYRKKRHGYTPHDVHSLKNVLQNPSHVKFVVPWQMEEQEKEQEEIKKDIF